MREIDKTCSSQYCVSKLTQRMLKRLGQIANNKEIRQGRHRGQTLEELRDVELGEMSEAVKTARCLIEAYLRWLDSEG